MKRINFIQCLVWCACCLAASNVFADLRLPHIFDHNMVLQREKPVRVWGWASPGEKVTVRFGGQTKSTAADAAGNWLVTLDRLDASFAGRTLTVAGSEDTLTRTNILVGEVWLCGGQSNMEFTLRGSRDGDMEVPSAHNPALRFFRLPHIARMERQPDFPVENPSRREGHWQLCTPPQVEDCSAVGYYFGRRLLRRLNVPVGLIDTSWGGTMAQHWVPVERLRPIPEMQPYFDQFARQLKEWNDGGGESGAKQRYEAARKEWERKRDAARAKGEREPRRPDARAYVNPAQQRQPGGMFNGMIAPLARLAIRGVLFYQGENNSFTVGWKPFPYTFPAVIAAWREVFGEDNLPFGILQIAGWSTRRSMTYDMNHHCNIVREIQFLTWQRTPHTGLIVTFDTNAGEGIHPRNKLPVGERSARWALAEVYGIKRWGSNEPLEWRGPVYAGMKVQGDKIIIRFEAGSNRGLLLDQDVDVGFYIAGQDQQFHHAHARVIKENQLQVWSEDVPAPVAVRYGWSNLPAGGLMNGRELPAYPFRTDTWPLVPHQSTGAYAVSQLRW